MKMVQIHDFNFQSIVDLQRSTTTYNEVQRRKKIIKNYKKLKKTIYLICYHFVSIFF